MLFDCGKRAVLREKVIDFFAFKFAFKFAFTIQKLLGLFVPLHCSTLNVR